jgi:calcium homeostasis ER protein
LSILTKIFYSKDIEQKNIIEKLANFVARNGPEFENVTKLKQKDNPKFNFLFGGEYFSFYQYRLSVEREAGKMSSLFENCLNII